MSKSNEIEEVPGNYSPVPGASPTGTDAIKSERIGDHIVVIRIDRPHRRNALDGPTSRALAAALKEYDADESLFCAILTGSDVVFSAGADLIAAAHPSEQKAREERAKSGGGGQGSGRSRTAKPLIAAVEGHALAGGLELALSCDMIVSSRTATMGLPETARSLVAIGGGLLRLPKRIPYHIAMELVLTGKPVTAERMAELGLVNRLAEPGEALKVAIELANDIVAAGPLAVKASKQIVQEAMEMTEAKGFVRQMEIVAPLATSEDLQEGLRAFAEKRAPVWKNK